jgi:hypothetical protein
MARLVPSARSPPERIGQDPMSGRIWLTLDDERWTWVFEQDDVRLASNHDYGSRDEAVRAARRAYPDAALAGPEYRQAEEDDRESRGFLGFVLMTMAVWRFSRRAKKLDR